MWKTVKLGDVCQFQSGLWKGKKLPFQKSQVIRNTNFTVSGDLDYSNVVLLDVETKQLENRRLKINDIILEKSGGGDKTPVGRVCMHTLEADTTYSFSNFTSRIRVVDDNKLDPMFLHRFLYFLYISGKTESMQRHSTGIRNLQLKEYKEINVPLPPLEKQKLIVKKLDATFAEINKNIENLKNKKEQVENLVNRVLEEELKNAEGENVKLEDICDVIAGQSPESKYYNKEKNGIPFYQGSKDFGDRYLNEPRVWTTKISRKALAEDILVSVRAPVGDLNITSEDVCIGRGLAAIRTSKAINRDFLFNSLMILVQNIDKKSGAVFNSINKKLIQNVLINLPPLEEQKQIVKKLDAINLKKDASINSINKQIDNYMALKSSILTQELEGKKAA